MSDIFGYDQPGFGGSTDSFSSVLASGQTLAREQQQLALELTKFNISQEVKVAVAAKATTANGAAGISGGAMATSTTPVGFINNGDGTFTDPDSGVTYDASGHVTAVSPDGADLSMSTVQANPQTSQPSGSGGADVASAILNAIGRWGTVITSTATGRPVQTNPQGVPVGAKGSVGVTAGANGNGLLIIIAIGVVILLLIKR